MSLHNGDVRNSVILFYQTLQSPLNICLVRLIKRIGKKLTIQNKLQDLILLLHEVIFIPFNKFPISVHARREIVYGLLPQVVDLHSRKNCLAKLLEELWKKMEKLLFQEDDDSKLTNFQLLVGIFPIFTDPKCLNCWDLRLKKEFWFALRMGLVDENKFVRKLCFVPFCRSIRSIIDAPDEFKAKLSVCDLQFFPNESLIILPISWDNVIHSKAWTMFMELLEGLENYAGHLLTQMWEKIDKFISIANGGMGQSWINIVLKAAVSHENVKFRKNALNSILNFEGERLKIIDQEFVFDNLLNSFLSSLLYDRGSESDTFVLIANFFKRFFLQLEEAHKTIFVQSFFDALNKFKGGNHFFYPSFLFIESLPCLRCFNSVSILHNFRHIVVRIVQPQASHISNLFAKSLLIGLTNLVNPFEVPLSDLLPLLQLLWVEIKEKDTTLSLILDWLGTTTPEFDSFIASHLGSLLKNYFRMSDEIATVDSLGKNAKRLSEPLAFGLCLLDPKNPEHMHHIEPFLSILRKVYSRSYLLPGSQEMAFLLLSNLVKNSLSTEVFRQRWGQFLLEFVCSSLDEIVSYTQTKLFSLRSFHSNHENMEKYLLSLVASCEVEVQLFNTLLSFLKDNRQTTDQHVDTIMNECICLLSQECFDEALVPVARRSIAFSFLSVLLRYFKATPIWRGAILLNLFTEDLCSSSIREAVRAKLFRYYLERRFECVFVCFYSSRTNFDVSSSQANTLICQCNDIFETSNILDLQLVVIQCLIKAVKVLFLHGVPSETEIQLIENSIQLCWDCMNERRRGRSYKGFCAFISLLFQVDLMRLDQFSSLICNYFRLLIDISETMVGIIPFLAHILVGELEKDLSLTKVFVPMISELCRYGPLRSNCLVNADCRYLLERDRSCQFYCIDSSQKLVKSEGFQLSDNTVRVFLNSFLLRLVSEEFDYHKDSQYNIIMKLVKSFFEYLTLEKNFDYMKNSIQQRLKFRMLQSLCFLLPSVRSDSAGDVCKSIAALLEQNNMPSVRALIVLISTRFFLRYPQFMDDVLLRLLNDPSAPDLVVSKAISVTGHVLLNLPIEISQHCAIKYLLAMFPFLSVGHVNIKCRTLNVCYSLLKYFQGCHIELLPGLNLFFDSLLEYALSRGDLLNLMEKLKIYDLSLNLSMTISNLFFELPNQYSLPHSDLFDYEDFEFYGNSPPDMNCESEMKISDLAAIPMYENTSKIVNISGVCVFKDNSVFQRKIDPWKMELFGLDDQMIREDAIAKRSRQSLVIVATLLDKIPNLAGIIRTSEAWCIEEVTIPDLNVRKDKMFVSMSVAADSWIPIAEVKEKELYSYLEKRRSAGYTLLGLEQTSNSVMLQDFQFPKKAVIVLGKEREGIPPEFLHLLDYCVEIPQLGVTRSLNVHVSAAVIMWQYSNQMLFSQMDNSKPAVAQSKKKK